MRKGVYLLSFRVRSDLDQISPGLYSMLGPCERRKCVLLHHILQEFCDYL